MSILKPGVIRCLLIPTRGGQLLLPSTVVAEVFAYYKPEPVSDNQPNWLLGITSWREQRVPTLSIEEALSLPITTSVNRHRTIILHGLESTQIMPFYAFIATDIPRPLAVTEATLTNHNIDARRGLTFTVQLDNAETVWLPDLSYLENLLRQAQLHK
jgi:chemosensory pili system protein ChpC